MSWKSLEQLYIESKIAKKAAASKVDKNYDSYKNLRLRWVNASSIIAKTLWISGRTVSRYHKKWKAELQETVTELNRQSEAQKMLQQMDIIINQIWSTIISENMAGRDKIQALNHLCVPIKFKAEMMGIDKNSILFAAHEVSPEIDGTPFMRELDKRIKASGIDLGEFMWIRTI